MRVFIFLLLMSPFVFGQDSLKVSIADWKFIEKTYNQTDSSLVECEQLNKLYERRLSLFQSEIYDLRLASQLCDTLISKKDNQLKLKDDQINILKYQTKKQQLEIWLYRGGGVVLMVIGLLLIK